ncbi:MAG TPA: hypothetical protein PLB21_07545 [Actinomycetota bacterium]|nr:hypothetical protein [Actinomycetota bacterium]
MRAARGSPRWRARWALLAFLTTWAVTRAITTVLHIRGAGGNGGIVIAGVHIHHAMFGLVVLLVMTVAWALAAGWTSTTSQARLAPILFGVAWALILDEVALIINLRDVYWTPLEDESFLAVGVVAIVLAIPALIASPDPPAQAGREQ